MYQRFHKGLVALGKIFDTDLSPITKEWSQIYKLRCKTRGKVEAVKFMKELNTVAERYALHQEITPLPWTRSSKDGFPKILNPFKRGLRSKETSTVVLTLSVFRAVEDLKLPISKDISSVTEPCSYDKETLDSIIRFIPEWLRRLNKPLRLPRINYHFTLKNGPNGHALKQSDMDVLAVMNDPSIYGAIRTVEDLLRDTRPMKEVTITGNPIHSKLTQISEKAGKTRTIAIIDYYSQRCLKPLHEGLMELLRNLVSDGTYSHQAVGKFAKQKTEEKSFILCTDLSAATDRFPSEIQRVLLDELIGIPELSSGLWTLLAKRTFTTAWSGEKVTYQCGQPMGAYASWPLFSLAHHLVVEYCANEVNTPIKQKYRIIGDDNIITDKKTAELYLSVMRKLGLNINQGKTVLSLECSINSCAEVAKQLYLNGKCLTPLTPGFIRDLGKPYMFNTCLGILRERYEFIRPRVPSALINAFFHKERGRRLVWLLGTNPINGLIMPSDEGCEERNVWDKSKTQWYIESYRKITVDALLGQAEKFLNESIGSMSDIFDDDFDFLDFDNIDIEALTDMYSGKTSKGKSAADLTCSQPQCYSEIRFRIESQLTRIINGLSENLDDLESICADFDYVPDPSLPYMERKEMKHRRHSSMIEKLYKYNDEISWEPIQW